jgi:hypothetical protein
MSAELSKLADAILTEDPDVLERETQKVEDDKERRRRRARRNIDAEDRPPQVIPRSVSLADRFQLKKHPIKWRIEKIMKIGQRVVISAQFKAGKTTFVVNIVRSLVDGVNFLDAFEVSPVNLVTVLDFEMAEDDPNLLDEWYQDVGIKKTAHVHIKALRGRGSSFNILDEDIRARWAADLKGTTVLVVDCLRPILDALGLDENRDAGKFFTALDALLKDADIREAIIVHHMGHQHERSRGDSRILDYPDVIWTLVRENEDPASPRFIKSFARGIDQPETALTYNPKNRRMGLGNGSRRDTDLEAHIEAVLGFVRSCPKPPNQTEIRKALKDDGISDAAVRKAIRAALKRGDLTEMTGGTNNRKTYEARVIPVQQPTSGAPAF